MRVRGALLLAAILLSAAPARAQLAVFDPTNYAQNLLQAARALEQVQNQVASLQNEAAMLAGQAKNLTPLGLRAAGALNGDLARLNGLLTEAGRLTADVEGLRSQFERQYPATAPDSSGAALAAAAESRWATSLESFGRALQVQASVTNGMAATNAQVHALASASEGAVGALQAAQVGNQLLAVQAKQLSDLTALLAVNGQATSLEQARAAAAAVEGRARLGRFLGRRDPP